MLVLSASLALADAKVLWASTPASYGSQSSENYILKTGYPVGNGKLGAIPFGAPGLEKIVLNIDSLWSGGPFENTSYRGGNPTAPKSAFLPGIRSRIFKNGLGDVSGLLGSGDNYGSYRVMGNLSVTFDGPVDYTVYNRSLDLTTGVHTTVFWTAESHHSTSVFCSYADQVCVYHISSSSALPAVSVHLENLLVPSSLLQLSCGDRFSRLTGYTQAGPPRGMKYDAIAAVAGGQAHVSAKCLGSMLRVSPSSQDRSLTVVIAAATDYDQKRGNAANGYDFGGDGPGPHVERVSSRAAKKTYEQLLAAHLRDYTSLQGAFSLDLPDAGGSAGMETSALLSSYRSSGSGDPYLEALLFDYSRHLLISSSRRNSLPANLQGRWADQLESAWSGDYHANINLQMNYWVADQTGLADPQMALWNYMADTWVPRGTETAKLLYNAPGFVVHDEINIFGFTGMKNDAMWANYPAAAAWMMQHVWDNFDYTQDVGWLKKQGYPLIKAVAQFWLSQLQRDTFSNDNSLVVNPCNSPEHGPTTFGCAHYQQVIHQVFEAVLSAAPLVSENDTSFLNSISTTLESLDKGLHFTSWGGIKEWRLPDSYGYDTQNAHRHLSHLVGWHPGYSISSFAGGYRNSSIQSAIRETLTARGNGNASDANAGWAKVWRSACWARLNDTERAYYQLRFAIDANFAPNALSMYAGENPPFQIDANLGLGGAVLSMLVVDLPLPYAKRMETRTVVLGPAIPSRWGNGSVRGLRLRGGGSVDFEWDANGLVMSATLKGREKPLRVVNKIATVLAQV
ncbi:Six-hairpin glycosidase-like protein [Achaetomium macrosporum]|uniref:Six-hairpin glycosidase-like protein n=1 Tax=Achaetomium macrosporum TaxID=79813 RepID=A0AAN7C5B9_9PEZI|nr:Six-hairpin glycosidase-like protein [Achaetomium macrosporum]